MAGSKIKPGTDAFQPLKGEVEHSHKKQNRGTLQNNAVYVVTINETLGRTQTSSPERHLLDSYSERDHLFQVCPGLLYSTQRVWFYL